MGLTGPVDAVPTARSMLDGALAAAMRGWSVVPVRVHPAGGGVEALVDIEPAEHHRATAEELRRWWRRHPEAGVGVVTGMLSGLLVVTVDESGGGDGTLAHLEAELGPLPATAEVRLAGRERHCWFRHAGPRVLSGPVAHGVGVQADDGGLAVCPPTPHPAGDAYHWAPSEPPMDPHLAAAPDWVLDLARHPRVERPPHVEQLHLPVDDLLTAPSPPSPHGATTLPYGPAVPVVGESRHQRELLELAGGRRPHGVDLAVTAELVLLPGNSHDPHPLGVRVHGVDVGRVVGIDAERCRPAVIAAIGRHGMATCAARIRGGWEHDRIDRGRFGITLHLSPELPDESTPN